MSEHMTDWEVGHWAGVVESDARIKELEATLARVREWRDENRRWLPRGGIELDAILNREGEG